MTLRETKPTPHGRAAAGACAWLLIGTLMPASLGSGQEPAAVPSPTQESTAEPIDFERARALLQRLKRGETLSVEERAFLERAKAARRAAPGPGMRRGPVPEGRALVERASTGLVPLCDMTAAERYLGQEGGLYGDGDNAPPDAHRRTAEAAVARIVPRDGNGLPAADGLIGLISISMSNATQEFSTFKQLADSAPEKSHVMRVVDCAQGGQAMAEWGDPRARAWDECQRRLSAAGVGPKQVQAAWIKLANKGPRGTLEEHGRRLEKDTADVLRNAKATFPNLQVAYLSSRIYGGWSAGLLNPEPYAYEGAFVVRWLIQRQIAGDAGLACTGDSPPAPVLLWGPYLWADGTRPRRSDGLTYDREDLAADGTHPSLPGRRKVAGMLLDFFTRDPLAKPWFTGGRPAASPVHP